MSEFIDLKRLDTITAGDKSLKKELLLLFLNTMERCLSALEQFIDEDDEKKWQETIHELKGAAYNIGFTQISGICEKAEELNIKEEKYKIIEELHIAAKKVEELLNT